MTTRMKFLNLFPYSLCHFYASTMTIKKCSKGSIPIVKRFLDENFLSPIKMVFKIALIRKNGGLNIRFYVRDPEKAHTCAGPRVLAYFG